jgi:tRNA A37 threonylcarbamoyladenosine synthetase subunit TsaC/SUA5/YrdC
VEDVPADLRERAGAVVDGGMLPGAPSTVLDFTGAEPRVLREGAASSADALARVADALR